MKSVTVITPTVASPKLIDAVQSVREQTYTNVKHLLVVDGPEYSTAYNQMAGRGAASALTSVVYLSENVGKAGGDFYGHRVYAAFGHLINSDYVCFLDEDNWFAPDHVETLVKVLEDRPDLHFSFSLRKIYSPDKTYLCDDNCESLGHWPTWVSTPPMVVPDFLIDTSSFCFHRKFLVQAGHLWHSGWGGDRRFLAAVRNAARFDTSGKHTLCYRLDGNQGSVSAEFFETGNAFYKSMYKDKGEFPWIK